MYTSKTEQVKNYIEELFFPTNGQEPTLAIPRADLNLELLRNFSATESTVNKVLEIYVQADALRVTQKKVERSDYQEE